MVRGERDVKSLVWFVGSSWDVYFLGFLVNKLVSRVDREVRDSFGHLQLVVSPRDSH